MGDAHNRTSTLRSTPNAVDIELYQKLIFSFSLFFFFFLIHISFIFSWPSLPFFRIMFWVLLFSNILGSENQSDDDDFLEEMNRSHANCILLQR